MSTKQGAKAGMKTNVRKTGCIIKPPPEGVRSTVYYQRKTLCLDGAIITPCEGGHNYEEKGNHAARTLP